MDEGSSRAVDGKKEAWKNTDDQEIGQDVFQLTAEEGQSYRVV